jgi:hypothetical protein
MQLAAVEQLLQLQLVRQQLSVDVAYRRALSYQLQGSDSFQMQAIPVSRLPPDFRNSWHECAITHGRAVLVLFLALMFSSLITISAHFDRSNGRGCEGA